MEVAEKIPITIRERTALPEVVRVKAHWDEFLDLLPLCEYRIEYINGEIISHLGFTDEHETLTAEIIRLLGNLLEGKNYIIKGSNLALDIPDYHKKEYCNADCPVIPGASQYAKLRGEMKAVSNPALIVEVLSETTRNYDLGEKAHEYHKIPSLRQLLFIDSTQYFGCIHMRQDDSPPLSPPGGRSGGWLLQEFFSLEDEIPILANWKLKMKDIYARVRFPERPLSQA